jgi:hypothetical protein
MLVCCVAAFCGCGLKGPGFAKAKELLVGLGAMLQRQLGQHLAGQPGAAWVDLFEVRESAVVAFLWDKV